MKSFFPLLLASQAILPAAQFNVGGHDFTLPEGYTIELVAKSPLVDRPIEADFDDKGRLYVTDSSGSNAKPDKQLEEKPHRIVRLEDTNGDGVFDKSIVFADKMMFPEGALWHEGSLYVSAPPSIWKLTDTNNDGVADERVEWFKGGTLTGCANDLHGPYLGPDGWIYWNKGAFAKQTHERAGEPPIVTRAAHTFRMRPDGSGLEAVMTGGMDNPVGLAFTPEGERFFTSTFLVRPEAGRRDGLVHSIYGGVYGKPNDVNDDHPQTGDLMPVTVQFGAAAPAGLMRYESTIIPELRDNMFVAQFNTHKVSRHALQRHGATYKTVDSDFVLAADTDFHPTDVFEDADGSILIIDTGGWYKLCCPTSQLAKPDVLGAIYRVRKAGVKHARQAPDARAIKLKAVWATARDNSASIEKFLSDSDETIRIAAIHVASLKRNPQHREILETRLKNGADLEKRAAAEALGRLRNPASVPAIISAARPAMDRTLEHSLAYALIEIADVASVRKHLPNKVALIALSQIKGGLTAADIAPLLTRQDQLRQTAEWIAARHPEWGSDLAQTFRDRLAKDPGSAKSLEPILTKLSNAGEIQALLAELAAQNNEFALRSMAASGLKKAPAPWLSALNTAISASPNRDNLATARALDAGKDSADVRSTLERVAAGKSDAAIRIAALRALPEKSTLNAAAFALLLENISAKSAVEIRSDAVAVLTRAGLTDEQRLELAGAFGGVGPMELTRLFDAFEKHQTEAVGLRLIDSLKKSPVLASLPAEWIDQKFAAFPEFIRKATAALPRASQSDLHAQRAKLEALLPTLKGGDIPRGQAIFNSAKAACTSCHAIGYAGGRVGPDLTSIGQVRTEMDLLEAIIYPSASFVRSYEPIFVKTKDGDTHTGILRGDNDQAITLVTGPNAETRIARAQIEEMRPGQLSIMPAGLETQLNQQELADLLAFLKATKWGAN